MALVENARPSSQGFHMTNRRELANAIRALAMDAVQEANSGHPGAPMGMADIAAVLWREVMRHNPANPLWPNRDRFILSNGHASMLLYAVLHLTGYPLGLDEIKRFRQLGSHTAGHPEYEPHIGIETTTGPLGQGLAMSVGFALAEKMLAAQFNRPDFPVVDHHTYVFLGDGCLMEGISHEACSFAGTLQLGKLIAFYDDNGIYIDGKVEGWFTDDTPKRFEAYGWHVIAHVNGLDGAEVHEAIEAAKAVADRPSLICCKTIIGYGAPTRQGTKAAHGEALGADEVAATRKALGWTSAKFVIPQEVRAQWDARDRGARLEAAWRDLFRAYAAQFPALARELERRWSGELPSSWSETARRAIEAGAKQEAPKATRVSSQDALNIIGPALPELFGGSADLTGSNNTQRKDSKTITGGDADGNYVHYGVREFGMTAVMNGLALHGGIIPYGGTFLVFSDYARNAVRLACLMQQRVVLVYTHDSIGLGEDGPTHQPIEHLASLRAMPNMTLWRPCDSAETAVAWVAAIEHREGPSALVLTRQNLVPQQRSDAQLANVHRGAYTLIDCAGTPECLVIATGSEVALSADAVRKLNAAGARVRLVSMPCTEVFDRQDQAYRDSVLPPQVERRIAVEAAATQSWWRYVGCKGRVMGIDRFGASGKASDLFPYFGFTVDHLLQQIRELMQG